MTTYQKITDVSVLEDLGFRVEWSKDGQDSSAPICVHGKRGACYGLMRNINNPDLLFVYGTSVGARIKGWTWFKVVNGKLTTWS